MSGTGVSVLRLKTREQFQAVMASGMVARTPHFALHRCKVGFPAASSPSEAVAEPSRLLPLPPGIWLGALVPKRWAKRAVTRNAIKRQIFAVSSEPESYLAQAAHVVRLRAGFARDSFISASSDRLKQAVRTELQQLFALAAKS